MVCPVTRAMYYLQDSVENQNPDITVQVYLPQGKWYDYYTKHCYEGGRYITVEAPLDKIPLFVKAGAIIPRVEFAPSTMDMKEGLEIYVYTGADGEFLYYNDSGDGYGYESGNYDSCRLQYSEAAGKLTHCSLLERENVIVHYV